MLQLCTLLSVSVSPSHPPSFLLTLLFSSFYVLHLFGLRCLLLQSSSRRMPKANNIPRFNHGLPSYFTSYTISSCLLPHTLASQYMQQST
ncbi:hypothetical protein BDQ17DRAFT_339444 [Cyathus striatus]|nr:hypothetical protein BDQ17DRAFT_339444 [Cyathus striatus]